MAALHCGAATPTARANPMAPRSTEEGVAGAAAAAATTRAAELPVALPVRE